MYQIEVNLQFELALNSDENKKNDSMLDQIKSLLLSQSGVGANSKTNYFAFIL